LQPLLAPESIAVVGANDDPSTYGGRLWGFVARSFPGRSYAVNRRPGAVRDGFCVTDLGDLPEAPDVVVLATPSRTVPDLLAQAGAIGARSVIVLDRESLGREHDLRAIADRAGTLLLGPNCLGLINVNACVPLSSSVSLERGLGRGGPYAFVSQSGALAFVLHARAIDTGLGLGLYISTGSQAQLRVEDFLQELADHPEIRTVATYIEDQDVPRFEAAARALAESGKRLIVLKGGLTGRGGQVTAAHSRSLASNGDTFRALAAEVGAAVVRDVDELLAAVALSQSPGPRLGLATISGGLSVVGTDQAVELGLPVVDLTDQTRETLRNLGMPASNPLDMEAVASGDEQKASAVAAIAADDATDTTVLVLNDMPGLSTLLQALGPVADAAGSRLVVCSACSEQERPLLEEWVASGRSYVQSLGPTLSALAALHPPRTSGSAATPASPAQLAPLEASEILASGGVPMTESREVRSAEEARAAAAELGYPLVLKIARAGHRGSEGVRVGLQTPADVMSAFDQLGHGAPVLLQRQARPGLEFYVGTVLDPRFGLLLFLGMGGPRLEGARDVAVTRCPIDRQGIRQLLGRTAAGRWLESEVSQQLVDLGALVDVACRAVDISYNLGPRFESLDLNPVIVHASGATVVDGKITLAASADAAQQEAE
jgi:acyl-CoA synthetase (NDP forming)